MSRTWLNLGLSLVAIIGLYWLTQQYYFRQDLTRQRLYTLNDATVRLLSELDSPLRMEFYLSEKIPPRFAPIMDFVTSMAREYEARSGGKVQLLFKDPGSNIDEVDAAHKLGIFESKANVAEKSRIEMTYLWFGLALHYQGRKEVFPSITNIENFEYEVSSAIVRLLQEESPRVVFLGPTYARETGIVFDIELNMQPLAQALRGQFQVSQIRVTPETAIDLSDADLVMAWGLHRFSELQLYALDQYMMAGNPVVFFLSGVTIDPVSVEAQAVPPSLADDFLANYGVAVNRDLVADRVNTKIRYEGNPPVFKDYPLFPALKAESGGLDTKEEPTASLQSLVAPWPSSLKPLPLLNVRSRVLARTSAQSWRQTENFIIDPDRAPGPTSFDSYVLGMAFYGRYATFFEQPPAGVDAAAHLRRAKREIQLHVWGGEQFLTQSQNASIPTMVVATADHLTSGYRLSGVDRRGDAFRPIRGLDDDERRRVQWLSVIFAPIIVICVGVGRRMWRRYRRLDYGSSS